MALYVEPYFSTILKGYGYQIQSSEVITGGKSRFLSYCHQERSTHWIEVKLIKLFEDELLTSIRYCRESNNESQLLNCKLKVPLPNEWKSSLEIRNILRPILYRSIIQPLFPSLNDKLTLNQLPLPFYFAIAEYLPVSASDIIGNCIKWIPIYFLPLCTDRWYQIHV